MVEDLFPPQVLTPCILTANPRHRGFIVTHFSAVQCLLQSRVAAELHWRLPQSAVPNEIIVNLLSLLQGCPMDSHLSTLYPPWCQLLTKTVRAEGRHTALVTNR